MFKFHKEGGREELQLWIIRWFAVISHRVNPLQKKLSPLTPYFYLSLLFFFSRANETKEVNLSSYNRKNFI